MSISRVTNQTIRHILTKKRYKAWLEEFPSDIIAGAQYNLFTLPLTIYLNTKVQQKYGHLDVKGLFSIMYDKVYFHPLKTNTIYYKMKLPEWAQKFQVTIFPTNVFIPLKLPMSLLPKDIGVAFTCAQLLKILSNKQEEVMSSN